MPFYWPAIVIGFITGIICGAFNRHGILASVGISAVGCFTVYQVYASPTRDVFFIETLALLLGVVTITALQQATKHPSPGCPGCGQPFPMQTPQVHICDELRKNLGHAS